EKFTVPVDALVETTIETPPPTGAPAPSPAQVPEAALPVARPRPRAATATHAPASDLGLPDLKRGWMFPHDDDVNPIMPEPPARRMRYEDGGTPLDY
ncbi:MAG: hypothetical protein QOF71_1938, partial [Candidatus Eremiobacteraeota bacterium]|nr:hypothetical protein [Candidatus Eremiobacteraeota bacterium]